MLLDYTAHREIGGEQESDEKWTGGQNNTIVVFNKIDGGQIERVT